MKVLTSSIDQNLDRLYESFEDEWGFGPCGAYAALRREQGWGDVAVCMAWFPLRSFDRPTAFTHYVIVQDGAIIDLANPTGEELLYTDLEILDPDEMPELNEDGAPVRWLRERI